MNVRHGLGLGDKFTIDQGGATGRPKYAWPLTPNLDR